MLPDNMPEPGPGGVLPGEERGTRRGALRHHAGGIEFHAVTCERIQMRRRHASAAVAAQRRPALVIR
jgi:hypothetical protein